MAGGKSAGFGIAGGGEHGLRDQIYLPKATVQAAIGSVPLAAGLPCGKIILSVAVLAILITAPIGAIGIDSTYKRFLEKQKQ